MSGLGARVSKEFAMYGNRLPLAVRVIDGDRVVPTDIVEVLGPVLGAVVGVAIRPTERGEQSQKWVCGYDPTKACSVGPSCRAARRG